MSYGNEFELYENEPGGGTHFHVTSFSSFFIKTSDKHNVNTRFATRTTFYVPKIRTNYGKFNIRYNGPILWNETDERFKILTPYSFTSELSMYFINLY